MLVQIGQPCSYTWQVVSFPSLLVNMSSDVVLSLRCLFFYHCYLHVYLRRGCRSVFCNVAFTCLTTSCCFISRSQSRCVTNKRLPNGKLTLKNCLKYVPTICFISSLISCCVTWCCSVVTRFIFQLMLFTFFASQDAVVHGTIYVWPQVVVHIYYL